jgi:hypothetical protein
LHLQQTTVSEFEKVNFFISQFPQMHTRFKLLTVSLAPSEISPLPAKPDLEERA